MAAEPVQANVVCANCGASFSLPTRYFQIFGETPLCENCAVHTKCNSCEKPLRVVHDKFRALGGDPIVCVDCAEQTPQKQSKREVEPTSTSFWNGLSIGEKIVFPLLLLGSLVTSGLAVLMGMGGMSPEAPVKIAAPFILLTYWTYRRGKKNN